MRRHPVRRPVPRLRWSLAATGSLALVLAGVLAVGALHANKPPPGTGVSDTKAAQVLRLAALAAQEKPAMQARPDQFVFIESVTAYGSTVQGQDGKVTQEPATPIVRQVWLSVDGTRDGLLRQKPRSEPGMPEELPLSGCRNGHTGNGGIDRPCQPQPAFRTDLPTTTDAMFSWLYKNSHGDNPRDVQAFVTVGDLIREAYLPPATLSPLFSAASRIPGVTVDKAGQLS